MQGLMYETLQAVPSTVTSLHEIRPLDPLCENSRPEATTRGVEGSHLGQE